MQAGTRQAQIYGIMQCYRLPRWREGEVSGIEAGRCRHCGGASCAPHVVLLPVTVTGTTSVAARPSARAAQACDGAGGWQVR